ncbi:follistatin-like isoform X2 [Dreissena polymorpha]|uniref:Kazal-like domain-containing protein n=2 Tax=Dreissena polymorpha TaxID=45954 RepID=A0A9D4S009_DREPO|nr:follistatin-like [Dreissena polymorpha]XP_052223720.1 follistatin-like isoform X2 [Dreissena polymorpha]KAH3884792.1 hypothetical protein DPMN_008778 [Dreissena polymorpha]KAH3885225.1 hypothetical protein DPMN_009218 [Dreissena polymorpha]
MKGLLAIFCAICLKGCLAETFYSCSWIAVDTVDCSTFKEELACGTNLITYRNKCEFSKAHCRNPNINLKHYGACDASDGLTTPDPVKGAELVLDFMCTSLSHMNCPVEEAKVCASNGRTYRNYCEYEKAKCTHRDISVVSYGDCTP